MDTATFLPSPDQAEQIIDEALNEGFRSAKGRLPKNADERRDWMRDENGAQTISQINPIAFAVEANADADFTKPESFLADNVEVAPVVNPLFHALMLKLGASPKGTRSYEISAGKGENSGQYKANVQRLMAILEVLPGAVCYAPNCAEQGEKKGFRSLNGEKHKIFRDIYCLIHDTAAGEEVERTRINGITQQHPEDGPLAGAAIIINSGKGRIFVKVCTSKLNGNGLLFSDEDGTPDLDRLRPSGKLDPRAMTPDRAVSLMETAASEGYTVLDPQGTLAQIKEQLAGMVVGQRVPGAPGQSRLVVGGEVKAKLGAADKRLPAEGAVRVALASADAAGEAVKKAQKAGAEAALAPEVRDVIAMAEAKPVSEKVAGGDLTLRDYQREAVGLHLSTQIGYLQACSVGLGKTAITLSGMRATAEAAAK